MFRFDDRRIWNMHLDSYKNWPYAEFNNIPPVNLGTTIHLHWYKSTIRLERTVFTCDLIYLFIYSVRSRLGSLDASRAALSRAMKIVRSKRQYLMFAYICLIRCVFSLSDIQRGLDIEKRHWN